MDANADISAVQQLPTPWQDALKEYHAKPKIGRAAGDDAWSIEEHAQVLLQFKSPGANVFLKDVSIGKRTAKAIKRQWEKVLSKIVNDSPDAPWPERALPPPSAADYDELRSRLDACCLDLRDDLRDGLVSMHAEAPPNPRAKVPWQIEEDGLLLAEDAANKSLREIEIARRSTNAIRQRFGRLRKQLPTMMCAFPLARTNPEAPYQYLHYNQWTRIDPNRALPPDAHIDWHRGMAKAPEEWELWLNSSRFCFFNKDDDNPINANSREVFLLEDVSAAVTVADITQRLTTWMKKQGGPLADAVDHTRVRLAILDDGQSVTELEAVQTPAGSADHYYSAGQRVYYRCRDGVPRSAMVIAVNKRRMPDIYTIAVDYGDVRANSDELFSSYPPPRFPPRPFRPLNPGQQEFEMDSRVWYDGPQVGAPRQARIVNVMSQVSTRRVQYDIILEGDMRDTTAALLSPVPIDAPLHLPPWEKAEIEEILKPETSVREADLFNRAERIIVVTDEVTHPIHGYWDMWRLLQDTVPCPSSSSSDDSDVSDD